MVCFEVATRREPFPGKTVIQVMRVVDRRERPQPPAVSDPFPEVASLMEKCWKHEPTDRPAGFHPVVQALSKAMQSAGGDPRDGRGASRDSVELSRGEQPKSGDEEKAVEDAPRESVTTSPDDSSSAAGGDSRSCSLSLKCGWMFVMMLTAALTTLAGGNR